VEANLIGEDCGGSLMGLSPSSLGAVREEGDVERRVLGAVIDEAKG
jgi:hypothetical protein